MDDELRILLENVSGRFDALSREIADASTDIARYAAGTTTTTPLAVVAPPPVEPTPQPQPAVACARCGNVLNPTTRFCIRCGSAVAAVAAAAAPEPVRLPEPAFEAPAPPPTPAGPRWTLSEVFALRALGWLAGVVTLLGIVFLYALAEQRGWVGPGARVGFGVAVSSVLLGAAFVLRARYGDELEALAAAGTAVAGLYVSLFASVELYHLIPKAAGLPLALAIAGLAVAIAWRWSSEPLAVLGLAGAMIAPPVSEHAVTPFSMVLVTILAVGAAVLWVRRDWLWLIGVATGISLAEALAMISVAADQPRPFAVPVDVLAAATAYWAVYQAATVLRRTWPGSRRWDGVAVCVSVGGAAFAFATIGALFGGDERGLAFVALAGIYLALTGIVWRLGAGTRDLLSVYWVSALTAAGIGAVTLLHGDVLIAVLALSGALQVELARRLREPRLQLSAAVHIVAAAGYALAAVPPGNLLAFPADGLTRNGVVSGDLVLSADLSVIAVAVALTVFSVRHFPVYMWESSEMRRATFWAAVVGVLYAVSTVIVNGFLWYQYSQRSFENGHTLVSATWAGIALLLVWFGFRRDATTLRIGGIALLVGTLAKLFLFDLAQLEAMARAVSFIAVGVISLTGAVVYRRMAERAADGDGRQAGRGVPSTGSEGSNV
ncbi:MAG: DUF2339 domain-containing protein [Gaiellales bacterium]